MNHRHPSELDELTLHITNKGHLYPLLATIHLRPVSGNYQIIWMNKSDQLLHIISAKNDNEFLYDRVE